MAPAAISVLAGYPYGALPPVVLGYPVAGLTRSPAIAADLTRNSNSDKFLVDAHHGLAQLLADKQVENRVGISGNTEKDEDLERRNKHFISDNIMGFGPNVEDPGIDTKSSLPMNYTYATTRIAAIKLLCMWTIEFANDTVVTSHPIGSKEPGNDSKHSHGTTEAEIAACRDNAKTPTAKNDCLYKNVTNLNTLYRVGEDFYSKRFVQASAKVLSLNPIGLSQVKTYAQQLQREVSLHETRNTYRDKYLQSFTNALHAALATWTNYCDEQDYYLDKAAMGATLHLTNTVITCDELRDTFLQPREILRTGLLAEKVFRESNQLLSILHTSCIFGDDFRKYQSNPVSGSDKHQRNVKPSDLVARSGTEALDSVGQNLFTNQVSFITSTSTAQALSTTSVKKSPSSFETKASSIVSSTRVSSAVESTSPKPSLQPIDIPDHRILNDTWAGHGLGLPTPANHTHKSSTIPNALPYPTHVKEPKPLINSSSEILYNPENPPPVVPSWAIAPIAIAAMLLLPCLSGFCIQAIMNRSWRRPSPEASLSLANDDHRYHHRYGIFKRFRSWIFGDKERERQRQLEQERYDRAVGCICRRELASQARQQQDEWEEQQMMREYAGDLELLEMRKMGLLRPPRVDTPQV